MEIEGRRVLEGLANVLMRWCVARGSCTRALFTKLTE
jgi:hypothetical protein